MGTSGLLKQQLMPDICCKVEHYTLFLHLFELIRPAFHQKYLVSLSKSDGIRFAVGSAKKQFEEIRGS
jgi:hypothetical protein